MQIKTPNYLFEGTFDELVSEMESDSFWIRFFIRPCCPKPDSKNADRYLNDLRQEIDSKADLDTSQKATLFSLIDKYERWYKTKFCIKADSGESKMARPE